MEDENKRNAVNISVTLSTQLMAAALAMLAINAAFLTFVIGDRDASIWFYIISILTFLLFVSSIVVGGKGISKIYREGFDGSWSIDNGKSYYNRQALLCIAGLFIFFVSLFFSGPSKETLFQKDLITFKNEVRSEIDSLASKIELIEDKIKKIEHQQQPSSKKRKK